MPTNLEKFRNLLQELFQLDQADLDFGIYRIMNQKRDEIVRFLDKDLLPQVREAFKAYKPADKAALQKELDEKIAFYNADGIDPESVQKVKDLRKRLAESAVDVAALENEVFSHLFNFFRRYYQEGDFISLRRYKEGLYAIPYEGEEVKLHWANADQYYIKSSEAFRDYIFTLSSGKRVRVHLVAASSEQNDSKPPAGTERRFFLCGDKPLWEDKGDLYISFEYRLVESKDKQAALNAAAIERILDMQGFEKWTQELAKSDPSPTNPTRTLLEKHLNKYTAENTFDYFVHKDLKGFLRRELDFYLMNEVMRLDDIEYESLPRVEQYLSKIKVIRTLAHKIIAFFEQLENFQKKLWLKKKFVIETNYCVTLDRLPEELFTEVATNEAQRKEWVQLFAIDQIAKDLTQPGYTVPMQVEFLKGHLMLPIDTRHFPPSFTDKLLAKGDELFASQPRWMINGENLNALMSLATAFHKRIRCVYIDPPYNTGSDEFLYKDQYQHSSWCSLLHDRLKLAHYLLQDDGSIMVSIGEEELGILQLLLDLVFGRDNRISIITVKRASATGHKVINPGVVNVSEYVLIYAKNRSLWIGNTVYAERERDERYSTFVANRDAHHNEWTFVSLLDAFAQHLGIPKASLRTHLTDQYDARLTDFVYKQASSVCQPVTVDLGGVGAEFREWVAKSRAAGDQVLLYKRNGFPDTYLRNGKKLIFYREKLMRVGDRVATAEKASDIWTDVLPNDLHNEGGVDLPKGKKPESLISRLIELGSDEGDIILDFFAGTATTAAVAQKMNRRWIVVESAGYFDEKPLKRMKLVLNGEGRGISGAVGWKGGGAIKVMRGESYEDAIANLELHRTVVQASLIEADSELREQYVLSYMLDLESRGSQSLLNVQAFRTPDQYKLKVERNGERQLVNVDLVETFNWLLGLTVTHIDVLRGVRVVDGTNPQGERVLVLWRNIEEMDNDSLDKWFEKQDYNTREMVYDVFYVNGDNNLENLRRPDETWKVRSIEKEFKRLMFDVQDV